MITGGMGDFTAIRRLENPSLRVRQFPEIKPKQIYKHNRTITKIKILRPSKKEFHWVVEVIKGKNVGYVGDMYYNTLYTDWNLV